MPQRPSADPVSSTDPSAEPTPTRAVPTEQVNPDLPTSGLPNSDVPAPAGQPGPAEASSARPPGLAAPVSAATLRTPPHLSLSAWRRARRRLVAKMLAEFSYEDLLAPSVVRHGGGATEPWRGYEVGTDAHGPYAGQPVRFHARRGAYGHWRVDPASPRIPVPDGSERPVDDPVELLTGLRDTLGLGADTTAHLIRELLSTLLADVHVERDDGPSVGQLAELDYATLEGWQTGHPWLVPNKGRVGFSAADAARWAPEARVPAPLPWIAVHTRLAEYQGAPGLHTSTRLYQQELTPQVRQRFTAALRERGLTPDEYLLLPVHPWQWDQTVVPLFADALASGDIVALPSDGDLRLPQQSVRTFLNVSDPNRHTVKLPLSVLNTLVWRGLPTDRTAAAPAVTGWVRSLRDADHYLREETGVVLLGEVASVTVRHPVYDQLPDAPYQYRELLGAIWREPLHGALWPHERARTLAALLWTDAHGRSLTAELVARSGATPRTWFCRLTHAILAPLLHFLYRYGLVFSPHGENSIVIFDESGLPSRLAVKDFVDDVNISAEPLPELADLPEEVDRVLLREQPRQLCQFIHSGLFVGVFRYLAPLMEEHLGLPEDEFWDVVRQEILAYQEHFPELHSRFATFDLLTERIDRLCLNRNRLLMDGYRDRAERPHAVVHGTVPNPLAPDAS